MIITKTPFRMSFFGGGTDMPAFFNEHGGAVISTTFDKFCYVNVRHMPPFHPYISELVHNRFERVNNIEDIEHPLSCRNHRGCVRLLCRHSTTRTQMVAGALVGMAVSPNKRTQTYVAKICIREPAFPLEYL